MRGVKKNNTVIITGAASGLGRALAFEFHKLGYNLALIDVDNIGLQSVKNELLHVLQKTTIHHADVSDEQRVISVREEILKDHSSLHMLINNAAISISQSFIRLELPDSKKLFDINFWGTVYCSKYFLPDLEAQPNSRLVNVISDFALMGFPGKTAYASSKGAVMAFSNCLKTELSDKNVKVCLVIPPPLNTSLVKKSKHVDDSKRAKEAAFLERNSMPVNQAAARIVIQIENGKYRIVVGAMMFWIDLISRIFPTTLHNVIGKNKKQIDFV